MLQRESNETVPVVQNQLTESRRRGEGREGKQLFQSFGEGDPLTIASDGRFEFKGGWTIWMEEGRGGRIGCGEEKESRWRIRVTRRHYPHGRDDGSWKFQALKCGPDKSRRQAPHPFSIQTRRKVAYPLGASILSSSSQRSPPLFSFFPPPFLPSFLPSLSFFVLSCKDRSTRVSGLAVAQVPPLAITMKDGHRIWPRSFLTNTHLRAASSSTRNYDRPATNSASSSFGLPRYFFFPLR